MARIKTNSSDQYVHTFDFEEGEELLDELNSGEGISPELSKNMTCLLYTSPSPRD